MHPICDVDLGLAQDPDLSETVTEVVMSTETVESRAPMYCGTIRVRYSQKNMMVFGGSFALKTQSHDKDGIMKVLCCLAGADF